MSSHVIQGDCVRLMAYWMPANSVDAIVTDPPYGLEFMGREWDKLDGGLPQEAQWKGRRGKGGGSFSTKPGAAAFTGDVRGPNYGGKRSAFKRCTICGRREFSGSPCQCEAPDWVIEYPEGAPSSSIRMQRWHENWARAAFRVLKPGGHMLAFGGTRTYHRLACALEDAGFEVRDCLMWIYGSGFPKSHDISKAIDREAGAVRGEGMPGPFSARPPRAETESVNAYADGVGDYGSSLITAPATPEAAQWEGWGTALKPAWEPIILARKPIMRQTVAQNVQAFGTGALNIGACRVEGTESTSRPRGTFPLSDDNWGNGRPNEVSISNPLGRWPANVAFDPEAAAMLDAQSGERRSGGSLHERSVVRGVDYGTFTAGRNGAREADTGGASRFFYTAKASRAERNAGLHGMPERLVHPDEPNGRAWDIPGSHSTARANHHPTVKPIELMRWLIRLIAPPGGLVLDPFNGSGSTGCAAVVEGFDYIGLDLDGDYIEISERRIEWWSREAAIERQQLRMFTVEQSGAAGTDTKLQALRLFG